jgi:hypothetical protein
VPEVTAGQADRCPYARPFAADFAECPAFVPRRWPVRALDDRQLAGIWTCWHLTEATVAGEGNRHYARCSVGDAGARVRWSRTAGSRQVAAYRAFRQAVGPVDDGLLAAATAEVQSSAFATGERAVEARRQAVERLIAQLRESGSAHEHLLAGSGLAAEDWVAVTQAVFEHSLNRGRGRWRPAPELLRRLTPAGRRLVSAMTRSEAADV